MAASNDSYVPSSNRRDYTDRRSKWSPKPKKQAFGKRANAQAAILMSQNAQEEKRKRHIMAISKWTEIEKLSDQARTLRNDGQSPSDKWMVLYEQKNALIIQVCRQFRDLVTVTDDPADASKLQVKLRGHACRHFPAVRRLELT